MKHRKKPAKESLWHELELPSQEPRPLFLRRGEQRRLPWRHLILGGVMLFLMLGSCTHLMEGKRTCQPKMLASYDQLHAWKVRGAYARTTPPRLPPKIHITTHTKRLCLPWKEPRLSLFEEVGVKWVKPVYGGDSFFTTTHFTPFAKWLQVDQLFFDATANEGGARLVPYPKAGTLGKRVAFWGAWQVGKQVRMRALQKQSSRLLVREKAPLSVVYPNPRWDGQSLLVDKGHCYKWPRNLRHKSSSGGAGGVFVLWRRYFDHADGISLGHASELVITPRAPRLAPFSLYPRSMKHRGSCQPHAAFVFSHGPEHTQDPKVWAPVEVALFDPKSNAPLAAPWITNIPVLSTLVPVEGRFLKLHQKVKVRLTRLDVTGRRATPQTFTLTMSPVQSAWERAVSEHVEPYATYATAPLVILALLLMGVGYMRREEKE